jgi:hypothetical protein
VPGDIGTWSVTSPKQLSDGTIFLLATDNGLGGTQVGVWDLTTNSLVTWPTLYGSYDSIAKSSNGKKVLLASSSSSGCSGACPRTPAGRAAPGRRRAPAEAARTLAANAILNFRDTGLSILEIGHRTSLFQSVMDEAVLTAKELMKLDKDHEVLFLHGGATTQFFQVPMNLLNENQTAVYLDCGVWGSKAIQEARIFGNVDVVASSKDKNYTYIPKGYLIPENAAYFHYTTNNTIEGTEMFSIPETNIPLVADMSSDILSHEIDFNRFALIYAGAQ